MLLRLTSKQLHELADEVHSIHYTTRARNADILVGPDNATVYAFYDENANEMVVQVAVEFDENY